MILHDSKEWTVSLLAVATLDLLIELLLLAVAWSG
jgi:hypothetical protein